MTETETPGHLLCSARVNEDLSRSPVCRDLGPVSNQFNLMINLKLGQISADVSKMNKRFY